MATTFSVQSPQSAWGLPASHVRTGRPSPPARCPGALPQVDGPALRRAEVRGAVRQVLHRRAPAASAYGGGHASASRPPGNPWIGLLGAPPIFFLLWAYLGCTKKCPRSPLPVRACQNVVQELHSSEGGVIAGQKERESFKERGWMKGCFRGRGESGEGDCLLAVV